MQKIRKVVFPVGGLGTRFLPATKSMPKEMLPVVDKPLIQYAFEEAKASGIEQFIFVTGRNKTAINDHFDHSYELQSVLSERNKARELEITSGWLPEAGNVLFVRQQEPLGLGHAVWCARNVIGDEPFAVILADDLVHSKTPCLAQMIQAHSALPPHANMVALMDVPREQTAQYGVISPKNAAEVESGAPVVHIKSLVEKPKPADAPSTLSIIGRYILQPEIFAKLEHQATGAGGEIQLTDAINSLCATQPVTGFRFEGTRYDCGALAGFVAANVAYALERADTAPSLRPQLKQLLEE